MVWQCHVVMACVTMLDKLLLLLKETSRKRQQLARVASEKQEFEKPYEHDLP